MSDLQVAMATGACALLLTLAASPISIALLRRRQVMDLPNHRSSHDTPTVRGAGIAVLIATVFATAVWLPATRELTGLLAVTVALGVLGGADDLSPVRAHVRLGAQFAMAAVGVIAMGRGLSGGTAAALAGVGVLAVVAYVNAFNFMDGINGISFATAAVTGGTLALLGLHHGDRLVAVAGTAVAAAAIGFAPFNVPVARAFLGDVGSYFIGGWLALVAVRAVAVGVNPVAVAIPFLLYFADTGLTILRRARAGERLFEAHREHVYQRLVRGGWSHLSTTAVVAAATAVGGAAALAVSQRPVVQGAAATALAVAAVCLYLWLPATVHDTATGG